MNAREIVTQSLAPAVGEVVTSLCLAISACAAALILASVAGYLALCCLGF